MDYLVADGSQVLVDGFVSERGVGSVVICPLLGGGEQLTGGAISATPVPWATCGSLSVSLDNVVVTELPGWHSYGDGYGSSTRVRVMGSWSNDRIIVDTVIPAAHAAAAELGLPLECNPMGGSWPRDIPTSAEGEQALGHLSDVIAQYGDLYSPYWRVPVDQSQPEGPMVTVVGAVRDIAQSTARLAAIFPYNLCVIPVDYSLNDLRAVQQSLSGMEGSWNARLDAPTDRIVLSLPVLDEGTLAVLEQNLPKLMLEPLVRPAPVQ